MNTRRFITLTLLGASLTLLASACGEDHDHSDATAADTAIWEQIHEERSSGKADGGVECSGVIVPDQGNFNGRVTLTFDDGPNPETTPQVLDTLKAEGIQATFFINGRRVNSEASQALLQRILDEGHILANHSQSHSNFRELSLDSARTQVQKTDDIIAASGETRRYFRFPYGSSNCSTASMVRGDFGYAITGWHIDSADWCYASSTGGVGHCAASTFRWVPDQYRDDMVGYTLSQVRQNNGGILLFHDIHQNTANKLPSIIEGLRAGGYTFTNVDDVATYPKLNGVTPPFVGDLCAQDQDCAFVASGQEGQCLAFNSEVTGEDGASQIESFGFCTLKCQGFCPDSSGKAPTFCASLDEGATGNCLSKAGTRNEDCAAIPGTVAKEVERHIGDSSAAPSSAVVCYPQP